MFIISNQDTRRWPVEYRAPKNGGGFETYKFKAEYHVLPQGRIDAILARSRSAQRSEMSRMRAALRGDAPESVQTELSAEECAQLDQDILDEVFVTWHEVKNPYNSEYEDNPDNRAVFMPLAGMRSALVTAWLEMVGVAGETKNSKPPRTTG